MLHSELPSSETQPSGHEAHSSNFFLYFPTSQDMQDRFDGAPSMYPTEPALHTVHSSAYTNPVSREYLPTGHSLHSISETILYIALYFPVEQPTHSFLSFAHFPLSHRSQAVFPASLTFPLSQSTQFWGSSEPCDMEYLPWLHAVQVLAP